MLNKIKIFITLLFFILIISCNEEKKIIVHDCSNDSEANIDILRSINNNSDYLKENNIEIEIVKEKCGYTLIHKNKKKYIQGSITDIDLMIEIKKFYEL